MKTKIARNDDKLSNILKKQDISNNSIDLLVNTSRKNNPIKLRLKENKVNRRPKAPHNTTQYLSTYYKENSILERTASVLQMSIDNHNKDNTYSIENFIITGGSLKGI
jgi:hypothetical protein